LRMVADVRPHAIVSDYRLPGSYTGAELVARIRELLQAPDLPALLITGDIASARTPHPFEAEIPLLQKPVEPSVLYKEIVALLEASRAPV
jgi:two-component system, sensor histidine kinase